MSDQRQLPGETNHAMLARRAIVWPLRVALYGFAFVVGFLIVGTQVVGGMLGFFASLPFAMAAIGLDVFVTAKLRGESVEESVTKRLAMIDQVASPSEQSLAQRELEARRGPELERGHEAHLEVGDDAEEIDAELIDPDRR